MKHTIHLQTTLIKSLPLILFLAPTQIASTTDTQTKKPDLTQILKIVQKENINHPDQEKKDQLHKKTNTKLSTSKKTTVQTWDNFTKLQRPVTEKEVLALIQKAQKEQTKENQQEIKKIEKELEKEDQKTTQKLQSIEKHLEKLEQDGIRQNQQLAQQTQAIASLGQKNDEHNQRIEKVTQDTRETKKEAKSISQNIDEVTKKVEDVREGMQKNIQADKRNTQQLADISASIEQPFQESAQAREENNIQVTLLTTTEPTQAPITDYNPNTLHPIISQPQTQEYLPATATWWEWSKSAATYTAVIVISSVATYYLGVQKSPKKLS